ncbi:bacillithiol biosynthesis cysteine-adding enzyme BshC [bacterium]|nr:bacillithiol biosynthesis cysteine-adding enzyme BshC [bacterium]
MNYRKIPNQGELFYDYLDRNPRISRFYNGHHRNEDDIISLSERVITHDYRRPELCRILREINSRFNITPEIESNIDLLQDERCLTVITGQQVGLLSGPIYALIKAFTTIKAADYLAKLLNRPVVPLFWMECSDHDYDEVNHIYLISGRESVKISYREKDKPYHQSVGTIKLNDDFNQFLDEVYKYLPDNDYLAAVQRLISETYYPGVYFGEAFGKMMTRLCGRWGLIMVDSENVELKRLASPVIIHNLKRKEKMTELLKEQSEELDSEHYEIQIKVREELLNIFITKDNNRIPLSVLGELMGYGEDEKVFLEDNELLQLASDTPEVFSPKVSFRPIIQDFLFPTIVYIGGPSELKYFAQLKKVYEFFDIEMPIIWPRVSATLVDNKIKRYIQKAGVSIEDIFRPYEEVEKEILERDITHDPDMTFAEAKKRLIEFQIWLKEELVKIDTSLPAQTSNPFSKIMYQIEHLEKRTYNILKTRNHNLVDNWRAIVSNLYPRHRLQERTLNVTHFLSRHGFWLLEFLYENLDIMDDYHQIIEIPSRTIE